MTRDFDNILNFISHIMKKPVFQYLEQMDKTSEEFQVEMKRIKRWNVSEIDTHVSRVKNSFPHIGKVVNIAINTLASLLDQDESYEIDCQLFIHKVYINMGFYMYMRPGILSEDSGVRMDKLDKGFQNSVRMAMYDVFPLSDMVFEKPQRSESTASSSSSDSYTSNNHSHHSSHHSTEHHNDNDNDSYSNDDHHTHNTEDHNDDDSVRKNVLVIPTPPSNDVPKFGFINDDSDVE
jgi:hypothetical protein